MRTCTAAVYSFCPLDVCDSMHAHRHLYDRQVKGVSGLHMVWCINVGIKLLLNRHVVYIYIYLCILCFSHSLHLECIPAWRGGICVQYQGSAVW